MEIRLHNFSTGIHYLADMRLIACIFLLMLPESAICHLLPEKTGTIHLVGNAAFVAVSIPLSAFRGAVTQEAMQQQFNTHFQVRDQVLGGQPVLTMIMMPENAPTNYVVVLQRVNFSGVPRNLSLFTDFFRDSHEDKMLTLKVSRGKEAQMLVLTAGSERFTLLPGKLQLLRTFIGTGINHILTGPDHLLFLLTIVIGAAGWRYWAGAVSAFTVAHSITLTLSALGYVHVPSSIIEPGIAASIVLMALDNLFRPEAPKLNRIGLIFLCGLLHGLGFASSIADMGLDTTHRILSLLGFNMGIETGQFLFLGSLAASFFLVKRFLPRAGSLVQAPRLASATACVLGLVLFVQRVAS